MRRQRSAGRRAERGGKREARPRAERAYSARGWGPARIKRCWLAALIIPIAGLYAPLFAASQLAAPAPVRWAAVLDQPAAWYGSPEARAIADSVLAWQLDSFGWPKNIDMTKPPGPGEKPGAREATIDNGATITQVRLLARVYETTNEPRYRDGFWKGFQYLLDAQYPDGGWPQYFPLRKGYYTRITYNDDAMTGVMMLLWDAAEAKSPFTFLRSDTAVRQRARKAVDKGIDVILKTQIRIDGRLTAWCQQHDEVTLEPRPARTFEPVALVSRESVPIVRALMRIERPDRRVVDAVEAAVAWLRAVRIDGRDRWARFYEIGTNRPIFAGRDAVVRYRLEEVEEERQKGYSWYGAYAAELLNREYPLWKDRTMRARPARDAARRRPEAHGESDGYNRSIRLQVKPC